MYHGSVMPSISDPLESRIAPEDEGFTYRGLHYSTTRLGPLYKARKLTEIYETSGSYADDLLPPDMHPKDVAGEALPELKWGQHTLNALAAVANIQKTAETLKWSTVINLLREDIRTRGERQVTPGALWYVKELCAIADIEVGPSQDTSDHDEGEEEVKLNPGKVVDHEGKDC